MKNYFFLRSKYKNVDHKLLFPSKNSQVSNDNSINGCRKLINLSTINSFAIPTSDKESRMRSA